MKARLLLAVLLLPGCSLLLDPSKVKPLQCPDSTAACAVLSHADVACAAAACTYACAAGFADDDDDLAVAGSNGCERDCATLQAPDNPASLAAVVGAAPGTAQLHWPAVAAARSYRVCLGAAAGFETQCHEVRSSEVCKAAECNSPLFGLPNAVTTFVRVQSVNGCGSAGVASGAPSASFAVLDATAGAGFVFDTGCAAISQWNGGILSIEQTGFFCLSTQLLGTAVWQDFTLKTQLRFSSVSSQSAYGGLVLRNTASGHRVLLGLSPSDNNSDETVLIRRRVAANSELSAASSVARVPQDEWVHLQVVSRGNTLSASIGPTADSVVEVLRWEEPDGGAPQGALGFGLYGAGRAEFRQLLIDTRPVLPDAGPTSSAQSFTSASSDGGFSDGVRVRVPAFATRETCPAWPAAADCTPDAGCGPGPGARCAHLRPNILVPAGIGIDRPVGIDPLKPWRLGFDYAATPDAGTVSYPVFARGPAGNLWAVAGDYSNNLQALGQDVGRKVTPGTWNRVELRFDPEGNRFSVLVNGTAATPANPQFPPPDVDPYLGAFFFGRGSLAFDGWVTDITIAQP